ncbi:flagellar hook-associated protein FlgL [Cellulosilyticum ruminicola]|uniref:flagellar hook-associated protein FlgL n=1 Tax=Cellulosilyticum ruminicola TaxID=425254 RepID=UPI0006CFB12B|nr:flagellar hook-associated protein FlgL [Cellulosilyticum ruminicola]
MRVTNGMLINNTLSGLYKNMNNMNKLYAQMSTGKKIQTVSDDPIIAGRTLKLKSTILEADQYESNAKEAESWMNVTEVAMDNMTEILKQIRTKLLQGSTSTLAEKDKLAIKTDVSQLYEQILQEANVTYDGRYVFSGYKTNDSLILTNERTLDKDLNVVANMTVKEGTKPAAESTIKQGSTLTLNSVIGAGTEIPAGSKLAKGTILSADDAKDLLGITPSDTTYELDADYTIPAGTKLSKQTAQALGLTVGTEETYLVEEGGYEVAKGTTLPKAAAEEALGVKVSKDSYTITEDITLAANKTLDGKLILGEGCQINGDMVLKGKSELAVGTVLAKDSVLKANTILPKGSFNPDVYGKIDDQKIYFEVGTNNTIDINIAGMDTTISNILTSLGQVYNAVDAALMGMLILQLKNYIVYLTKLSKK